MELTCPFCRSHEHEFVASLDLPPDGSSDEIQLQVVLCQRCRSRFGARYEESRRGRLDSERWHHFVIAKEPAEVQLLAKLITTCPSPHTTHCGCQVHQAFAEQGSVSRVLAEQTRAPRRQLSETLLLLAGIALAWICLLYSVASHARYHGFLWLLVPPVTSSALWLLATPDFHRCVPPRRPRWWSVGAVVAMLLGLVGGVVLAVRY